MFLEKKRYTFLFAGSALMQNIQSYVTIVNNIQ